MVSIIDVKRAMLKVNGDLCRNYGYNPKERSYNCSTCICRNGRNINYTSDKGLCPYTFEFDDRTNSHIELLTDCINSGKTSAEYERLYDKFFGENKPAAKK